MFFYLWKQLVNSVNGEHFSARNVSNRREHYSRTC
jgi:hypothetical protein